MKRALAPRCWLLVAVALTGCSSSTDDARHGSTNTGGTAGSAGASAGRGASAGSGGSDGSGGAGLSSGAYPNAGGKVGAGGAASGGKVGAGGAASGGKVGAGGAASGGADAGAGAGGMESGVGGVGSTPCNTTTCVSTTCAGLGCGQARCCPNASPPVCVHGVTRCPDEPAEVSLRCRGADPSSAPAKFDTACTTDADCVVGEHWSGCCTGSAIGLKASEKAAFDTFEAACGGEPVCGCCCDHVSTDDGYQLTAPATPRAVCYGGACLSTGMPAP